MENDGSPDGADDSERPVNQDLSVSVSLLSTGDSLPGGRRETIFVLGSIHVRGTRCHLTMSEKSLTRNTRQ